MKIRVMSYNIHKGFTLFNSKFILHELKKAIEKIHADIVLLQEVVGENMEYERTLPNWPKEAQFEFLADKLWPHFSYGKNAVYDESHHGNAILSKFPIIKSENINISNHRLENRGLLHVEVQPPGLTQSLHILNTHLDLTNLGRKQQLKKIIQRVETHVDSKSALIIGGDFNDWSHRLNHSFKSLLGVSEAFQENTGSMASTFPSFLPILRLDRLYFKNIQLLSAHQLYNQPFHKLSDHIPIVAEFLLD